MTILPTTSKLRRSPLSRGELAAICARGRHHAYNLLVRQFKQSGLSQAELASRTGIDPAMLSRIFSRPSNLEIDTMSKLLLGMGGGALMFAQEFPTAAANQLYGRSDKSDLLPENPMPSLYESIYLRKRPAERQANDNFVKRNLEAVKNFA